MAKTAEDPNTWRLMGDELAFVVRSTRSPAAAEKLLLDYLSRGRIRYRYWKLEDRLNAGLTAGKLRSRVHGPPVFHFFWDRSDTHSRIDVDWGNHRAVRVGPVATSMKWFSPTIRLCHADGSAADDRPIFHYHVVVRLEMHLVRFHHDDVLTMLREVGLLPLAEATQPQSETKETAASWVPKAVKLHPRQPGWTGSRWAQYLAQYAPGGVGGGWHWRTIENALSDQGFIKKSVSQKASQKSHKK